jgi:thiol-disulfide isomerase/thioredoxin
MTRQYKYIWAVLITATILFPQCTPAGGRQQKGEQPEQIHSESIKADTDISGLPEISREIIRTFADAGLPVLTRAIPAEDFSAELLDGSRIRLTNLAGKVVFLNFWATWCGPCRMEMPSMEALYRELKDEGLEILAVDVQERKKDVVNFISSYNLNFPAALDPSGNIAAVYGIEAFPTTYIIDRNGGIITRVVGAINWNSPELMYAFRTLLKVTADKAD